MGLRVLVIGEAAGDALPLRIRARRQAAGRSCCCARPDACARPAADGFSASADGRRRLKDFLRAGAPMIAPTGRAASRRLC